MKFSIQNSFGKSFPIYYNNILPLLSTGTQPQSITMLPLSTAEEAINETIANFNLNLKPESLYITEEPVRSAAKPVSTST